MLVGAFLLFKKQILAAVGQGTSVKPTDPGNTDTPISKTMYQKYLDLTDFSTGGTKEQAYNLASTQYQKPAWSNDEQVSYIPPPGYQGPINGPFTWAGIGDPPNGNWVTIGNPVYN